MNCLCTCICQIVITLLIIIGIFALIVWLIFRPNAVKFHVTDAALSEFSINNNNTLHYNPGLNLTIRNPNKRIGIYYDKIEARAFYRGQRFSTVDLQTFYQGKKNTTNLNAEFKGQQLVLLGSDEMSKYNEDRSSGIYEIDIQLYLRLRLKFAFVKSSKVNDHDLPESWSCIRMSCCHLPSAVRVHDHDLSESWSCIRKLWRCVPQLCECTTTTTSSRGRALA